MHISLKRALPSEFEMPHSKKACTSNGYALTASQFPTELLLNILKNLGLHTLNFMETCTENKKFIENHPLLQRYPLGLKIINTLWPNISKHLNEHFEMAYLMIKICAIQGKTRAARQLADTLQPKHRAVALAHMSIGLAGCDRAYFLELLHGIYVDLYYKFDLPKDAPDAIDDLVSPLTEILDIVIAVDPSLALKSISSMPCTFVQDLSSMIIRRLAKHYPSEMLQLFRYSLEWEYDSNSDFNLISCDEFDRVLDHLIETAKNFTLDDAVGQQFVESFVELIKNYVNEEYAEMHLSKLALAILPWYPKKSNELASGWQPALEDELSNWIKCEILIHRIPIISTGNLRSASELFQEVLRLSDAFSLEEKTQLLNTLALNLLPHNLPMAIQVAETLNEFSNELLKAFAALAGAIQPPISDAEKKLLLSLEHLFKHARCSAEAEFLFPLARSIALVDEQAALQLAKKATDGLFFNLSPEERQLNLLKVATPDGIKLLGKNLPYFSEATHHICAETFNSITPREHFLVNVKKIIDLALQFIEVKVALSSLSNAINKIGTQVNVINEYAQLFPENNLAEFINTASQALEELPDAVNTASQALDELPDALNTASQVFDELQDAYKLHARGLLAKMCLEGKPIEGFVFYQESCHSP